jgi:hypothetical protein
MRKPLIIAMLVCCAQAAHASGWMRDPGHFYLQLGTAFSYGTDRYLNDGSTSKIVVPKFSFDSSQLNVSNYQQLLTDLYFEVGVLKRLMLFGNLGINSARQLNPGGDIKYTNTNVNDLMLGARAGLVLDPLAVALEARLGFPTGDSRSPLPTGSGDFRGELRLAISKAWQRVPIYFNFEFGFVLRGTGHVYDITSSAKDHTSPVDYDPQITARGEIGAALLRWHGQDRLVLDLTLDYVGSTHSAATTEAALALFPAQSRLTTINVTLMGYFYKGFGALFRFARTVEGEQQPVLTTFGGALFETW